MEQERFDDLVTLVEALAGDRSPAAVTLRDRLLVFLALVKTADQLAETFLGGKSLNDIGLSAIIQRAMAARVRKHVRANR